MSNQQTTPDATATIGTVIGGEQRRDAIHVAVEPMVAATALRPGEHVGFVEGGAGVSANPVGIVDPFLGRQVERGERFWLLVYPRQITSLRHVWSHPQFPEVAGNEQAPSADSGATEQSRRWIEDFAGEIRQTYESLMAAAERWADSEEYTYDNSESYKFPGPENVFEKFWHHYAVVTGRVLPESERQSFFACAC